MKKNKKSEIFNKKILFFDRTNYNPLNNTLYLNDDISKNNKSNHISYFIKNNEIKNYSITSKLSKYLSNSKNISLDKNSHKPIFQKIQLKGINKIFKTSPNNNNNNKTSTSLDYHKISLNENNIRNIKKRFPYADEGRLFSKIPLTPFLNDINFDRNNNILDDLLKKKISDFYYNKKSKLNFDKLNLLSKKILIDNNENDKNKDKYYSSRTNKKKNYNTHMINIETNSLSKKKAKTFIKKKLTSLNVTGRSFLLNIKNIKINQESILDKDKNSFHNIFNNLEIKKYFNDNKIFPVIHQNKKEYKNYKSIISKNKSYNNGIINLTYENENILNNYSFSNQKNKIQSITTRNKFNSISNENQKINNNIQYEDKCIETFN